MINIKSFVKHRNSTATVTTSSGGTSTNSGTSSPTNDWFYFNDDTGFVTCRYPLCSVDNIVAFADGTYIPSGGGGGTSNVVVVDNLTSYSSSYALSANMGRNLKVLIDNVQTQGGGGTASSIDWQNIQNVPSTFPPTSHTHAISDVNGLQTQLTSLGNQISTVSSNLSSHANNGEIHMNATEKTLVDGLSAEMLQFITKLMNTLTIDNSGNCTFNGNVNSRQNVTALV